MALLTLRNVGMFLSKPGLLAFLCLRFSERRHLRRDRDVLTGKTAITNLVKRNAKTVLWRS